MSDQDKMELKQKYGVDSQGPIGVIGYAESSLYVKKVVKAVSKYATVYLVGRNNIDHYDFSTEEKSNVHAVETKGVLRDYYAMADVAINDRNLVGSYETLHNFVEATEGGPLFMVHPTKRSQ